MKKNLIVLSLGLALGALTWPLLAQNPNDKPAGDKKADMGGMDEKMMAEMAKIAKPGEHHRHLKAMEGKWTFNGKFRMDPAQPWTTSTGESEFKWILGGRFLTQTCNGPAMDPKGEAFEGFGITGYDNDMKKYVSAWTDNMGTMIMNLTGECSQGGKELTLSSTYNCPMRHKQTTMRMVYKFLTADKFVVESFSPDMSGKEFQNMEITYSRKK